MNNIRNLGQITSAVNNILADRRKEEIAIYTDLQQCGAPSECAGLAFEGFDEETNNQLVSCISKFGYSIKTYRKELTNRCCGRWLHFHGFDELFFTPEEN